MAISLRSIVTPNVANQQVWATQLDSSSKTPLEVSGAVREDWHPNFGHRKFMYIQFLQIGGLQEGELTRFMDGSSTAITKGTTTFFRLQGPPLPINIFSGGLVNVRKVARAIGVPPEGETARIIRNTQTDVFLDPDDALSTTLDINDTVSLLLPWAVHRSRLGTRNGHIAGVAMADQPENFWGWVQFYGLHPAARAMPVGTALTINGPIMAGDGFIADGGNATTNQIIGWTPLGLNNGTQYRRVAVILNCGREQENG